MYPATPSTHSPSPAMPTASLRRLRGSGCLGTAPRGCQTSPGSGGTPSCSGGNRTTRSASATTSSTTLRTAAAVRTRPASESVPSVPTTSVSSSTGTPGRTVDGGSGAPSTPRSAGFSPARAASEGESGQRAVSSV